MKKYILMLAYLVSLTFIACKTDVEELTDNASFEIRYDQDQLPGEYYFSNFDDTIQVKFSVTSDVKTASVAVRIFPDGVFGAAQSVNIVDKQGVVKYVASKLGLTDKINSAEVRINVADQEKKLILELKSPWLDMDAFKNGKEVSTIAWSKGNYLENKLNLIERRSLVDTLTIGVFVDNWVNFKAAVWQLKYKIGKADTYKSIAHTATENPTKVLLIKSLKDWGVKSGDTLYISAEVNNKGVIRTSETPFEIKNLSSVLSNKVTPAKSFNPGVSKVTADTISFQVLVLKDEKKNVQQTRSWLKAKNGTWKASYTVGSSSTVYQMNDPIVFKSNDTLSVVNLVGAFGKLAGVNQYDTLNITTKFNFDGADYPIKHSFIIKK